MSTDDDLDQTADDVFKQTRAQVHEEKVSDNQFYRRLKKLVTVAKDPILPKGMTTKTLYDDAIFQKWL